MLPFDVVFVLLVASLSVSLVVFKCNHRGENVRQETEKWKGMYSWLLLSHYENENTRLKCDLCSQYNIKSVWASEGTPNIQNADVDANCSVTRLENLDKRSPNNTTKDKIDDRYLTNRWYHTGNDYLMIDKEPEVDRCGANSPIYLNESHPNVTSLNGTAYNYTACLKSHLGTCEVQLKVGIRLCGGRVEYYLTEVNKSDSAYCFEKTSESLYPNVSVGNVTVLPALRFETISGDLPHRQPYLDFGCNFTKTDPHFYSVDWYHDELYYMTLGPSGNISELILREETLLGDGKRIGTTFQCGVRASYNMSELTTAAIYSNKYFAGIVMSHQNVNIRKNETFILTFKATVPLGCLHPEDRSKSYTNHYTLEMFDREFNCSGPTVMMLSSQRKCGAEVACLREGDTWNPDQNFSIDIIARSVDTNDPTTYILDFRMQPSAKHEIWANYQPDSVTVFIPTDNDVFQHKRCYTHVDPHYRTTDGYEYDQHKEGVFVLYRNHKYGIEVQERTEECISKATCTCALAIRAGGDIFIVDTCEGNAHIGFKRCNDGGILKVIEKSNTKFEVHTPIGTYISFTVRLKTFWNVDIYMAPNDFGNTVGLCGNYDGNSANDLTKPDGTTVPLSPFARPTHYNFSDAWAITDSTKNIFSPNYQEPGLWNDSNSLFCVCEKPEEYQTRIGRAYCGSTQFRNSKNCTHISTLTEKYCTRINTRRKRSTQFFKEELDRRLSLSFEQKVTMRFKKSATDIQEEEAITYCTELLNNSAAAGFTNIFSVDDISATISECSFDVMIFQDYSLASVHWDAMNNIVKTELEKDPVYVANNSAQVLLFVQNSCENNCSGNGVCSSEGSCICNSIYAGSDCSIDITEALVIHYVTAYGFCDLRYQHECICFDVLTRNLLENFKCRSQEILVDKHTSDHLQSNVTYGGDYFNIFEGECCFPSARSELTSVDGGFYHRYLLSLSNDGTNFGNYYKIYIYDSTCQQNETNQNGDVIFSLKSGYCFIAGICVADTDVDIVNPCLVCNASADMYAWYNGCPENPENNNNNSVMTIVWSVVACSIVLVIVIGVIVRKLNTYFRLRRRQARSYRHDNNMEMPMTQRSTSDISLMFAVPGQRHRSRN